MLLVLWVLKLGPRGPSDSQSHCYPGRSTGAQPEILLPDAHPFQTLSYAEPPPAQRPGGALVVMRARGLELYLDSSVGASVSGGSLCITALISRKGPLVLNVHDSKFAF